MKLKSVPSRIGTLPTALAFVPNNRFTPNRAKLYGRRWRKERLTFLAKHRYCVFCLARGDRTRANVVDHIIPHKGNHVSFWDKKEWQPLCQYDHNTIKQSLENKANGDDELLRLAINWKIFLLPRVLKNCI